MMETLWIKGNKRLWVLFHGTGGDKTSLLYITGETDPQASVVSFTGSVGTGAERRYFPALKEGQVDQHALDEQVDKFLDQWATYDLSEFDQIYALGYSNGANFLISLLEKSPDLFEKVFLLHPSDLGWTNEGPGPNQVWYITMGAHDQVAPVGPIVQWINRMDPQTKSRVQTKLLDSYHGVTDPELDWIREQIEDN